MVPFGLVPQAHGTMYRSPFGVSRQSLERVFSEVRERHCAGELDGGTGAFYELLQIPHNPLRPLKGHRVASIGVHLERRIGDHPRAPLLFLAPKDGVLLT